MKCRIFKKEDGSVVYNWPSIKYQDRLHDCPIPPDLQALPFAIVDESDVPPSNSESGDYHEMIHFDGECAKENLKQDKTWEKCLMPAFLVKQKEINHANQQLDDLLSSESPDPVEVIKLKRKSEKVSELHPEKDQDKIYQIALDGLARAQIDKPVIRQKLQEKIASLKK